MSSFSVLDIFKVRSDSWSRSGGSSGRTWIGFLCLLSLRGDRVLGLEPT